MTERDYWAQLKYASDTGLILGLSKGRVEGQEIEKRKTAINLKAKGMPFDFILDVTGLNEDELKRILSCYSGQ